MPKGKTTPENRWQRIEYWIKRNPDKSIEECQALLDEKLLRSREAKPSRIEYWTKKFPDKSLEECQELLLEYKKETSFQCIEFWKKKYPEKTDEECQALLDEAKRSYLKKRPDTHGENNPSHRSKVPIEERRRRSPSSIEFWKKKYPEKTLKECNTLLTEHLKKLSLSHTPKNTSTCKEYWVARGYSEEEAVQKIKERQIPFTLENCIKRHGVELGTKLFKDRQRRWQNSLMKNFEKYGDGRSGQSEFAYCMIGNICDRLDILRPTREKWMYDTQRERAYSYDFTYNHKIIEFNGDYWHANPEKYDKSFFNSSKRMSAEEIWLYDKIKTEFAESKGYHVMTVWESEWKKDPENTLEKCMKFLND